jgi:hypothetical protein
VEQAIVLGRKYSLRHGLIALTLALALSAFASTSTAKASDLIDRDAHGVKLAVNAKGEALITYTAAGKRKHVVAWGAVNAIAPTRARAQISFHLDYAGGWGKYKSDYWKTFRNTCKAYTGPALAWQVTACQAQDGSYWALQAWQRMLPNYGVAPTGTQGAWELRLSHWTGELPTLEIDTDWAWRQWDHLFGTFRYANDPVYGFRSTSSGIPLDTFGRNVYVDTFNSAYGTGWMRENSFLTHTHTGAFCYSFNPHSSHPAGKGERYRATVEGPGVTPDVMWQGTPAGAYDQALDLEKNALITQLGDRQCRAN